MMFDAFPLAKSDRVLLAQKIHTQTVPQTLLLEGGQAELRRALARQIAEALVCTGTGEKPCGTCAACIKSRANSHPDIQWYAPPKKNATFKVETAREIRSDAFLPPNEGHNKVYILEDSQNMNASSENALLKILEEPPQGVYFLLTCTSASAMLPTILSRAMLIRLSQKTEDIYDEAVLQTATAIAKSLVSGTEIDTLRQTAELPKDRDGIKDTLAALSALFTAAMLQKNGRPAEPPFSETANALASRLTQNKLYALLQATEALQQTANQNANVNLLTTSLCYQLRRSVEQ